MLKPFRWQISLALLFGVSSAGAAIAAAEDWQPIASPQATSAQPGPTPTNSTKIAPNSAGATQPQQCESTRQAPVSPHSDTAALQQSSWEQLVTQGEKLLTDGHFAEAEKIYLAALKLAQKFAPRDPRLATTLDNLGLVYDKQHRYPEAEAAFNKALSLDLQLFGKEHASISRDYTNLCFLYIHTGKYGQAEQFIKSALSIDEAMGGPDHPLVALDLDTYATLLRSLNRAPEAEKMEARIKQIQSKLDNLTTANICDSQIKVGTELFRAGSFAEAEKAFLAANAASKKLPKDDPRFATTLNNLAAVYEREGRYTEAEQYLQQALMIDQKNHGGNHPTVSRDLHNLALLYDREGKDAESERLHKMAISLDQQIFGPEHPNLALGLENYAGLLRKLNRTAEAEQLERRSKQIAFKQKVLQTKTAPPL